MERKAEDCERETLYSLPRRDFIMKNNVILRVKYKKKQ